MDLPADVALKVTVRLMDEDERFIIAESDIKPEQREPVLWRKSGKYVATRQDSEGTWIYRRVAY